MTRESLFEALSLIRGDLEMDVDIEDAFGAVQELYWRIQETRKEVIDECTQDKTQKTT